MKFAKRLLMVAGAVALAGIIGTMMLPKVAHAVVSALVTVANTSANPVPTVGTDNPALQPFSNFQTGGTSFFVFSVPVGKTLVIEEFNMICFEPPSTFFPTDFRVNVTSGGSGAQYIFVPTTLRAEQNVIQTTRIYADPGSVVSIGTGSGVPSGSVCGSTVSGHLVSPL